MEEARTNIVVIMADQLAPQFTGTYGHPLVKTPHMDRLAAHGVRFDAAYCNSPLCAPSRFSMMSGQLVTGIASYDNASEFPSSIPTFAHYLRGMGYQTCLAGKMHFVGPDQLHGFEERLTTDIYPADYAWTPNWELPNERIDKWYHNMDSVREAGIIVTNHQYEYDEEVAFNANRKILDYARSPLRPFCLVASFIHPHDPYTARREWWDLYDHAAIDMPKFPLTRDRQDPFSQRLMDGIEASAVSVTDEEIRTGRHAYYGNTSYFDSQVGKLVRSLEETGLLNNTIVIVTADHGDMLGERGLWYKMNFFEPSGRVPLIMAGPGIVERQVSSPCSLVDLLPTMIDIAAGTDGDRPVLGHPIDGRSLLPMAQGGEEDDGVALGEYCAELTEHPVFMIRRGRHKYIHCDDDPALLFDLVADPLEQDNLAKKPAFEKLAETFAQEVQRRWDSKAVRHDVIAKQRQRRAVYNAMQAGTTVSWDYNPPRDASDQYVRNHMDWTVAAAQSRFPPLRHGGSD